jgi:hypothetical protein
MAGSGAGKTEEFLVAAGPALVTDDGCITTQAHIYNSGMWHLWEG